MFLCAYDCTACISNIGLYGVVPEKIHTPSQGKLTIPPPPLGASYANLRHSLDDSSPYLPPSLDGGNFLCEWGTDSFWNDPYSLVYNVKIPTLGLLKINVCSW